MSAFVEAPPLLDKPSNKKSGILNRNDPKSRINYKAALVDNNKLNGSVITSSVYIDQNLSSRINECNRPEAELVSCYLIDKDDDVDLELLMHQENDSGNEEPSPSHHSSTAEDLNVLNDSSDSIGSSIEEEQNIVSKPSFFSKTRLKSLPVAILAKRKIFGSNSELSIATSSTPAISLPGSLPLTHSGSPNLRQVDPTSCVAQQDQVKKMIWNIYVSDLGQWKEVEVVHSASCAVLLHTILTKLQRFSDLTKWSIIEQNSDELIERFVEDYEIVDDISINQECDQISRFCLNRTPGKYSILLHPEYCLPWNMLAIPPDPHFKICEGTPDSVKRQTMQNILTQTPSELCGWLYVSDVGSKKSWKKLYCMLRNSGLYYSSKGTSKEPQHLICVAEIHSARVWFPINTKKQAGWPTAFSFCLKPHSYNHGGTIRWFCAESNHIRSAWISGLRLKMNGSRFYESYLSALRRAPNHLMRSSSDRAINRYDSNNFVPMDFRGSTGRVIDDPSEIAMIEKEQDVSWRRRLCTRSANCNNGLERGVVGNSTPSKDASFIVRAIHQTQPWFRAKMTRDDAIEEIQRHGNLDGTFLVRDSQTIPGGTVVTLCHNQKPRHIPISLVERNGQYFYTADNGETRFLDLIQFVDFHRLNKGSLPCPLLYECTRQFT